MVAPAAGNVQGAACVALRGPARRPNCRDPGELITVRPSQVDRGGDASERSAPRAAATPLSRHPPDSLQAPPLWPPPAQAGLVKLKRWRWHIGGIVGGRTAKWPRQGRAGGRRWRHRRIMQGVHSLAERPSGTLLLPDQRLTSLQGSMEGVAAWLPIPNGAANHQPAGRGGAPQRSRRARVPPTISRSAGALGARNAHCAHRLRPDRCRRRRHHGRDDHCCSGPGVLGAALSCAWASRKGAQARRARAGGPRAGARRCRRPPGGAAGPGRWAAPVCLLTNAVLLTCRGKPARRVCQPLTAPACPATCRRGGGGPAGGRRPC